MEEKKQGKNGNSLLLEDQTNPELLKAFSVYVNRLKNMVARDSSFDAASFDI